MQKTSDINVVETRVLPTPAELLADCRKPSRRPNLSPARAAKIHRLIFTDDKRFS